MDTNETKEGTNRRNFLGTIATGAAAIGLTSIAPSISAFAGEAKFDHKVYGDPEEMFKKINGKHRIVFDSPHPHEVYPFAWPRVFLLTNEATGTANKDCSVVVVLRHSSIGYAMEDRVWAKYELGKTFEANDPETNAPALRNPFWKPKPGAFKFPGIGEVLIGVNQLQESGVGATSSSSARHTRNDRGLSACLLPTFPPVPTVDTILSIRPSNPHARFLGNEAHNSQWACK
jgi:hypothetical protein